MSDFKNQVQNLLDSPAIRYGSADSPASMIWFEHDTIPRELIRDKVSSNTVTRTRHTLNSAPLTNDTKITFTANAETYSVIVQLDGAAVTPAVETHSVTANTLTGMTDAQVLATILAAMRALPNITAIDHSSKIVILDDTDRTSDVVASGTPINTTDTNAITDSGIYWPEGYRPGDRWTKNEYLIVLQTWITGGDDQHVNIVAVCRADLQRLATDFDDIVFPDDLARDNYTVSYPYRGDSREITWTFQMAEIGTYTKTAAGTAHPLFPEALLIDVQSVVNEGTRTVTHIYRKIGAASEQHKEGYSVTYECPNTGASPGTPADRFPVVTLRLDVKLDSFVPATLGDACPITGANDAGSDNAELDFNNLALKLREPPVLEPKNTVYGTVIMVYSKLPSYLKTRKKRVDFPEDAIVYVSEWYSTATAPVIDTQMNIAGIYPQYALSYVTDSEAVDLGCGVFKNIVEHAPVPAAFTEWDAEGVNYPPLYPAAVSFPPSGLPYPGGRFAFSESAPSKITYSFTRDPAAVAAGMPTTQQFFSYLLLGVQDAIANGDLDEEKSKEEQVAQSISRAWWQMPRILHDTFLIKDPADNSVVTIVSPSFPSSSLYRTWIAAKTRFVVRDVQRRWRGKIYMRILVEVTAR